MAGRGWGMSRVLWPAGRFRWVAAASALLLVAAVVTYLSLEAGRKAAPGAVAAASSSPSPASGLLEAAQGAAAVPAAPPAAPANVPAAAPPAAVPAAADAFDCTTPSAICYWTGQEGVGHMYVFGDNGCFGGPANVGSIFNNTDQKFVYLYADGTCGGDAIADLEPGGDEADVASITNGTSAHSILVVDPQGQGNLAGCDNTLCLWPRVGYSGGMDPFGSPMGCLVTGDSSGDQRYFSVANTSSDLVGYLYASPDCAGQPAVVAPGDAFGNLGDGETFGSIRVVKLAAAGGTTSAPMSSVLVAGPGGASLFSPYSDLSSCKGSVAAVTAACFLFADGTVVGQIDPVQTVGSVLNDLLPGASSQLAALTHGDCVIVPHMGSSADIVEVVNRSASPMVLGPGSCDDLSGTDPGNGTVYSVAAGLTGIVGPTVAAVAYEAATPATSDAASVTLGAPKLLAGPSAINGLGFTHLGDMPTVVSLTPEAPGDAAGLIKDDQIVSVNGQPVDNFQDYLDYIGQIGSNTPWTLELAVPDTEDTLSINVQPASKPVGGGGSVPAAAQ